MPNSETVLDGSPRSAVLSFSRLVSMHGMTVKLCIDSVDTGRWMLRIYGARGQVSEWMQSFDSPVEAMSAGMNTLQIEGIEHFYADPCFAHCHPSP